MTSYALYINDGGNPVYVTGAGDSAAATAMTVARVETALDADLPAGTPVAAPAHAVGSAKLQVYLDGVLCVPGEQYTDATSNSVKFLDSIPAGHQITAVAFTNASDPSDDMAAYIAALAEKVDKADYEREKAQALEVKE